MVELREKENVNIVNMIYEITCKDSNNEVKTLAIQDTDKIKISLENNKDGDFITFRNDFNDSTEKSSEMITIFNFLSDKKNQDFNISTNINDNKFSFTSFDIVKNATFTTYINTEEDKADAVFSSMIQVTL